MTASSDDKKGSSIAIKQDKQYRVDDRRVKAAKLQVKARLICSNYKKGLTVSELSEILAELGHFDLAVQLAISHN